VDIPAGGRLSIRPAPAARTRFAGWSGACTGAAACTVDVSSDFAVAVRFERDPTPAPRYQAEVVNGIDGLAVTPTVLGDDGEIAGFVTPTMGSPNQGVFLWNGALHRFAVPKGWSEAGIAATAGGRIAGTLHDAPIFVTRAHAFVSNGTDLVDIGTLGGDFSEAMAMDSSGTVVGVSTTSSGDAHAFAWKRGLMTDLGKLPGKAMSFARAIGPDGTPIGLSCDATPGGWFGSAYSSFGCHAVSFAAAGPIDLGPLPDGGSIFAAASTGDIVGSNRETHGYLWSGGQVVDMSVLGSAYAWPLMGIPATEVLSSEILSANEARDAVGAIWAPISEGDDAVAILYRRGSLFDVNDLTDVPPGATKTPLSEAFAINARGQILVRERRGTTLLLTPR
jgi:probable HAF family extracellular repeat protein